MEFIVEQNYASYKSPHIKNYVSMQFITKQIRFLSCVNYLELKNVIKLS